MKIYLSRLFPFNILIIPCLIFIFIIALSHNSFGDTNDKPIDKNDMLNTIDHAEKSIKEYGKHQEYPDPNFIADFFIPDPMKNKSKNIYNDARNDNNEALLLLEQAKQAVQNGNYDQGEKLYKKANTMYKTSIIKYNNSLNLLIDGTDVGRDLAIAKAASIPASIYGKALGVDKVLYVAEKYTDYEIAKAFDGSKGALKETAKSILLDAIVAKAGIGEKFQDAWGKSSAYPKLNELIDKLADVPVSQREGIVKNVMAVVGKTGKVTADKLLKNVSNSLSNELSNYEKVNYRDKQSGQSGFFNANVGSPNSQKKVGGEETATGPKEGVAQKSKSLEQIEGMSKKELREELAQKLGYSSQYDQMSKRELISSLTGISKDQIHASGNDPKKPDKQAEPKGKSLDQYEKMSKEDLRKELEKKTGEKGKYDNLSQRELVSALAGVPKDQVHISKEKDKKDQSKDLDQYENMSKKELRKELEKKTGKSDKFDQMSKRELVSALTGIPKDKIDLDKKEKDQAKKKDDDRQKKDGGAVTKLSKAQAEEIWKARPDVDKYVHDKKAGDPYKQTQKWWDNYGQKEMGNYQFAGATPAATPPATAASPAPAPSTPTPSPIKKLSKAQMEEIWKARPDVNENVHAKKKGDPYDKTQTWWDNYGRKEMGNYQFAGATPAATPPATAASPAPAPSTPAPSPIKKLSKAQMEEVWKARPDVNENVHAKKKGDPYDKTQTWWDNYGRKEMGNYQFAGTRPPTDTPGPPITAAPSAAPTTLVVSTPGPIPSGPSPGSVAGPTPVPSSSSRNKSGGSAKVIVGGKELQDGKYVMDNGYWQIKDGKIVSTGPLVDFRGKPIVDTKDAIKLGPNDKLIIDGHETKHGYRTMVGPVKGPEGQKPGEEGLKQAGEKPRPPEQRVIKESLRPRPQELSPRAQEEGQRQAEKDRKPQAQVEEKRRKQEEGWAEQERQKQAKLEEQRRRDEAKRLQEARKREEQAKAGEKLKAQQEENKRQEAQRRVEQERQRQAKAEEQRRREEQQRQAREQAQQRQAQMEQQRRADEQRQRAQQDQLRKQQEQQQRAQMEQQRRQQEEARRREAEQRQRAQQEQQRRQQEEAKRRQAQAQQQSQPQKPKK
jgi:hypothetical protein